jgi:glycosyltransferase involved in cell wall biosynthesis
MKVLHVVPSYLPATRYGGPIHAVHGLCRGLARRGHEIHVFTTNVDGPGDSNVPLGSPVELGGVQVWYFPARHFRRLYWAPAMREALKAHLGSFQLVHLHSVFLWPTWAAARCARTAGVPYVLAPRGMLVKDLVRRKSRLAKLAWIRFVERNNLERASAIHVTSERERDDLVEFKFRLPSLLLVPNGIDPEAAELQEAASVPDSSAGPYVLFLGRINWKKGLDRLLAAMRHAPGTRLLVAGNDEENYLPALERLAAEQGVRDRVQFVGPVEGGRKQALLHNALALVLPSYSENFGNAVLEAMAAARPVIVTPEVGLSTVVRETEAGLVVDGGAEAIGRAIARLASDRALGDAMGRNGRRTVLDKFTWTAVCEQMEAGYKKILRDDGSG